MPYKTLANYEKEQVLFTEFMESGADRNILLFQGKNGSGSSQLVEHFVNLVRHKTTFYSLKLQSGGVPIHSLFTQMGKKCRWKNLPYFTRMVADKLGEPENAENPVWRGSIAKHLQKVCNHSNGTSLMDCYQDLADAWFADAESFQTPFLLVIDPYDYLLTETSLFDKWFREYFLEGVAACNGMRVVISGKEVPEPQGEWSISSSLHELKGIDKVQTWMVWANKEGYQIPSEEALSKVLRSAKGIYSDIVDLIEISFPKASDTSVSFKWTAQLKEAMMERFITKEVRELCFDMAIDPEEIPNRETISGFVQELIWYCQRRKRLEELFQKCREARPKYEWVVVY